MAAAMPPLAPRAALADRRTPGRRAGDRQQRLDVSRLWSAFNGAPNGIALLDARGTIVDVNPSLCALFDCLATGLVGRTLTGLVDASDAEGVARLLDGAADRRGRPAKRAEVRCVRSDGKRRWAELSVSYVDADEGLGDAWIVAQIQDVQQRHEADARLRRSEERSARLTAELQRRNAELQAANLRLRGFASLASHDLSAPLASIGGVLSALQGRGDDRLREPDRQLLRAASERAERMRGLVEDLLRYARAGQQLRCGAVDLRRLAGEAIATLDPALAARNPATDVGALPVVRGDAEQLLRVLHNLIANAVKFVAPGVRPRLRIEALRRGDGWEIAVADNGPGVAEADRTRIFDPLERGQPGAVAGSGLGLAICAEVVARHGGRIWMEPIEGGGSRFAFTLPDDPDGADPAGAAPAAFAARS